MIKSSADCQILFRVCAVTAKTASEMSFKSHEYSVSRAEDLCAVPVQNFVDVANQEHLTIRVDNIAEKL